MGESIPTQEKLRVLARWLSVRADWLRFGGETSEGMSVTAVTTDRLLQPREFAIIESLQRLNHHQRRIVHIFVRQLARGNGQK